MATSLGELQKQIIVFYHVELVVTYFVMPVFSIVFFFATSALCYFDFRHFKYTTAISLSKRLWQILTGIKQLQQLSIVQLQLVVL